MKRILMVLAWLVVIGVVVYMNVKRDNGEASTETTTAESVSKASPDSFAQPGDYDAPGSTTVTGGAEALQLPKGTPNQTVSYPGFTVHYNSYLHQPNCVVYTLTANETRGRSERQETFEQDDKVYGCARSEEYAGSGYDRGHMAPAGDFKWNEEAMSSTFKMSNICPQNHELNKGMWNDLELKVREWARRDKKLVVYTGPVFESKKPETIVQKRSGKKGRVAVPTGFFKVIYAPTAHPARAIAFVMPNKPCDGDLREYVVTIDEVERLTGIDFLSSLPADQQKRLQATSNATLWFHSR